MSKLSEEQYLLTILAEEASEVAVEASKLVQRATKAVRFGLEEVQEGQQLDNEERIAVVVGKMIAELNDLIGTLELLEIDSVKQMLEEFGYRGAVEAKKQRIAKYSEISKSRGIV